MGKDEHSRDAEDLTAMLHVWPEIEEFLEADDKWADVAEGLQHAFRVEVQKNGLFPSYVLYFNVESKDAREGARSIQRRKTGLSLYVVQDLLPGGVNAELEVRLVDSRKPIGGEVCPRVVSPRLAVPALEDLPTRVPDSAGDVPLVERDGYMLTPIEAPFYDELKKSELTFAVQPWVEGPGRRYRPDFVVYYGGQSVVVELDGHEGHKTKEQRRYDAERERWFKARRMSFVRWTGTDVYADVHGCVQELHDILRGAQARP